MSQVARNGGERLPLRCSALADHSVFRASEFAERHLRKVQGDTGNRRQRRAIEDWLPSFHQNDPIDSRPTPPAGTARSQASKQLYIGICWNNAHAPTYRMAKLEAKLPEVVQLGICVGGIYASFLVWALVSSPSMRSHILFDAELTFSSFTVSRAA